VKLTLELRVLLFEFVQFRHSGGLQQDQQNEEFLRTAEVIDLYIAIVKRLGDGRFLSKCDITMWRVASLLVLTRITAQF